VSPASKKTSLGCPHGLDIFKTRNAGQQLGQSSLGTLLCSASTPHKLQPFSEAASTNSNEKYVADQLHALDVHFGQDTLLARLKH